MRAINTYENIRVRYMGGRPHWQNIISNSAAAAAVGRSSPVYLRAVRGGKWFSGGAYIHEYYITR